MDVVFANFRKAIDVGDGYLLASTLTPAAPRNDPGLLYSIARSSNAQTIQADVRYAIIYNDQVTLPRDESNAWLEVYVAYWKVVAGVLKCEELANQGRPIDAQWSVVYEAWRDVSNALIRGYSNNLFAAWTIPCLYVAGNYLRSFAIKADEHASSGAMNTTWNSSARNEEDLGDSSNQNEKLEDAARQINRIFSLCLSDRSSIEDSRKWALYYTINLLFKTYFKLNSVNLSKAILRSLQTTTSDMPPLTAFPKAHIVTFQYYVGVLFFLEEDYKKAEEHLTNALRLCSTSSLKNRRLILTYLIPCRMHTTRSLPSKALLAPFPALQTLFGPLCKCIKAGDLAGFDRAMTARQDEFVTRRIYLTLERARDLAMRNLLRKVFLAGGWEDGKEGQTRKTRISVDDFWAGLRLSLGVGLDELERDEAECLIANCIYKNLMKGYISRERGMVVLSKGGAFPGTGV